MKKHLLHILFWTLAAGHCFAQLSPGDLAEAHAHLEGLSNCTNCHELGNKVVDKKCLDCHQEINSLISDGRGFHANREVANKNCATCHSDHHGRKFDMVRFNEESFDHDLTGYDLTGAHAKIDCRQCHIPDFIDDPEIRKREETFLGLETACLDCHEDYHQQTLGNECTDCHTMDAFSPAERFDHDETDFALIGKHTSLECIDCHQMETRNGNEFQRFADVPFGNCNECHEDVHKNNLGTNCKQCHIEQSFTAKNILKRFRHSQTGFELKGQHKQIDCFSCHSGNNTPVTVFQDNLGTAINDCIVCHEDVHDGKFGINCSECHNEESFHSMDNMSDFNHGLTSFPLEGQHIIVDCQQCHISESLTDPMPFAFCTDCHDDYHEGELMASNNLSNCSECHTVEGFAPSTFSIEAHAGGNFPLKGAHLATPCFACHFSEEEEKWHFKNIGLRCVDCHEDVHEGEIATTFYPTQSCDKCHTVNRWKVENHFEHGLTAFALEGNHASIACTECHLRGESMPYGQFKNTPQECNSCHENVHGNQFEKEGITDCRRCHGFDGWTADFFDHNQTAFPLEGKHIEVACELCHQTVLSEGEMRVEYKMESFECIDCHN